MSFLHAILSALKKNLFISIHILLYLSLFISHFNLLCFLVINTFTELFADAKGLAYIMTILYQNGKNISTV